MPRRVSGGAPLALMDTGPATPSRAPGASWHNGELQGALTAQRRVRSRLLPCRGGVDTPTRSGASRSTLSCPSEDLPVQGMPLSRCEPAYIELHASATKQVSRVGRATDYRLSAGAAVRLSPEAACVALSKTRVAADVGLPRRRRCGSYIRPAGSVRPSTVWSCDFIHDQLVDV